MAIYASMQVSTDDCSVSLSLSLSLMCLAMYFTQMRSTDTKIGYFSALLN